MSWDTIATASFNDLEFEVMSISDSLVKRMARYKFPWRNGADLEDFGREPYETTVNAIVEGDIYEGELAELIALFNGKEKALFVHPVLGQWSARITEMQIEHDGAARDFANVTISVLEDGVDQEIQTTDQEAVSELQDEVNDDADDAIFEAITLDDIDQQNGILGAANKAKAFAESVNDAKSEIENRLDEVRSAVNDAVDAIEDLQDINRWPIINSLRRTADSARRLGDRVKAFRPKKKKKKLAAQQPLSTVVHDLYGSDEFLLELIEQNKIKNPYLVPEGQELIVYDA